MTRRVLALRALGLGDFLTGVPALRALRSATPGHELVLAAPAGLRPLVELSGCVDRLLPSEELAPVQWSGAPPTLAVDLHGNGPRTKQLLTRLQPTRLLAFAGPTLDGGRVDGPEWQVHEHEVTRWCRLVGEGLGVDADVTRLDLPRPAGRSPAEGAVVVHPGAASAARRWPVERWAEVVEAVVAAGEQVVVTGSGDEVVLARRLLRMTGLPEERLWAGRTNLMTLARLVAGARLVLGGDTGVSHLATAFGTPSVVLFGPVSPDAWGPPPDGPHDAIWFGYGQGNPHASAPDPALLRIRPQHVIPHVLARLEASAPTPAAGDASSRSSAAGRRRAG